MLPPILMAWHHPVGAAALAGVLATGCGAAALPPSAQLASLGQPVGFSAPPDAPAVPNEIRTVPGPGARATVIEFWGMHCEPCRQSVPALDAAAPALAEGGIPLVLVGVLESGESVDEARATLRSWGVGAGFLIDRGGGIQKKLGVSGLPATVVLDRVGVVRWAAPPGTSADVIAQAARAVAAR